jgi:rubrerythrin
MKQKQASILDIILMAKEARLQIKGTPGQPKSKEQAEAGNYPKGHTRMQGLDITIENLKGQYRQGTSADGTEWKTLMKHHYGYIKRTKSGADGDHVDVFIGPDTDSEMVFVVNQTNKGGKGFDEHKCMLGFTNEKDARKGYLANYEKGWDGLGSITALTMDQFKKWVAKGDTSKALKSLQKVGVNLTGLADKEKIAPSDVDPAELAKGIKVEMEHTKDKALAKQIALDHLTEMKDYYTKLDEMEAKEGKAEYAYSVLESSMKTDRRAGLAFALIKIASSMENVKEMPRLGKRELTRAVRDAIIEEQKAIKHYETVADSTENRRASQILQDIADEEKVHVGELEALLEELDPQDEEFREEGEEEIEDMSPGEDEPEAPEPEEEEEEPEEEKEASGRSPLVNKILARLGR